ncbi:MAG: SusE domain-containing protein [Bacteroides sp.]|nr:SusE domain-containing protein [Bacteroides sp.]
MKNIKILTLALAGLLGFTACDDDNDSNPVVQQPETFQLNTPALAGNTYDLEHTQSIALTCKQPEYGYTAAVVYYLQMSLDGTWVPATSAEADDATFVELDGSFTTCELAMDATAVNRNIVKLAGYESAADVPADGVTLYVRSRATLASGYECFSNVIELKVQPHYVALVSADPELWYLIGGCIGDGSWGSEIGVSVFPMSPVENGVFDDVTGQGPLTYTGYFPADMGFKLVKIPGKWDDQWGAKADNSITDPVKNDGASGDFKVKTSGYYRIDLDTKKDELIITAVDEADTPKEYTQMLIAGGFNGWAEAEMSPVTTIEGAKNNVWCYDLNATEDTKLLFFQSGWGTKWGGTAFPYGWAAMGGADMEVPAGTYRIIFDHISRYCHFYTVE